MSLPIIEDADIAGTWTLSVSVAGPESRTMVTTDVEPLVPKKVGQRPCACPCDVCRATCRGELWESD